MWLSSPWFRSLFHSAGAGRSLTPVRRRGSSRPRRRPVRHSASVEALEDRCLLSFNPVTSPPVGAGPQAVVSADFNNDGRLDLATANAGADSVSVLLGNGQGGFAAAIHSAATSGMSSLAAGDFNGDGKLDLATADGSGATVLIGNGQGSFAAPRSVALATNDPSMTPESLSVAVGDFNRDGKMDLAVTSASEHLYWVDSYYGTYAWTVFRGHLNVLIGDGQGGIASQSTRDLGDRSPVGLAVADLNTDGKLDVVTANLNASNVSVLLSNGDGTFGGIQEFATGWSPRAVTVGEFTGDGTIDIVTAGQTVDVLPGLGDGSFQPVRPTYVDPVAIVAADFNGDGKLDVVTAEPGSDAVGVLLGHGTGTFTLPVEFVAGTRPTALAVADFNGDGRPDVVAANAGSGTVTVLLNDGIWPALDAKSLRINDVTVTEGNSGSVNATFTITLSAAYNRDVTVRYVTTDGYAGGTATAGSDYQTRSGQVTIHAGQTSATVVVPVSGDRIGETTEYFFVRLSDPANAFILDGFGVGEILDDEPRITIDSSGTYTTEGNTGTQAVNFTVRLSSATNAPVSVNFSTAEGDTQWWGGWGYYYYGPPPAAATSGVDYQAQNSTLTFAAGETVKTITVFINGDRIAEPTEFFTVDLSGAVGAHIDVVHAVGAIHDDEPLAYVAGTNVTEGDAGTTTAIFTIWLSTAYDQEVRVNYSTQDGTALAGADYQAKSGTLVFAPGQTNATVTVLIYGDRIAEWQQYFTLALSHSTANVHASTVGYSYILDDEPQLSIEYSTAFYEGNTGTTTATFTVTLSAASDEAVSVNFSTVEGDTLYWELNGYYASGPGGFATANVDFQNKTGTLTFAPGETTKTISVVINGDSVAEPDEIFYVVLSNPTPNALVSYAYGQGSIIDDEPLVGLVNPYIEAAEGNTGVTYLTFTVSLSGPLTEAVSVNYQTHDGSAFAGSDYESQSGTLTFAPGETSKTIRIAIYGDTTVEDYEYFSLSLSDPSGNVRINNNSWGYGYIANDDSLPPTKGNKGGGKGGGKK